MRRLFDSSNATHLHQEAEARRCPFCGANLWKCQQRPRFVQRLDGVYLQIRYDKRCPAEGCPGAHLLFRPFEDLTFALPNANYGLDVIMEIGELHLRDAVALVKIQRRLNAAGVPISERHVGRLFRVYVSLTKLARGSDDALVRRLTEQGGVILMVDGVQFDDKSPVLYMVWDAISGEPLFGERKTYRGEADLVPLLEKVKEMGVPVLGMVTDKEKGLVPALKKVFPEVPYQYCQTHFLKNCASELSVDLGALGDSVARRAKKVRKIAKRLHVAGVESVESEEAAQCGDLPSILDDEQFVAEMCAMVRHASRASGRAPLNPPELIRHLRLEKIREFAERAAEKGALDSSTNSRRS
jgi:Transposase, Mutator family